MKTVGQEIKQALGEGIISDELAERITAMFNEAVERQVDARVGMAVDNELEKMDESHAEMLQKLMDSMDRDHTAKMKGLLEAMDRNYSKKLIAVAEKYERELHESASALQDDMNQRISTFLEMYLDKTFPKDMLVEACNNTRAAHQLAKIRDLVGMDASFIDSSVKEAIREAHDKMEAMNATINEKDATIKSLTEAKEASDAQLMLERKTIGLSPDKRDFVKARFNGRSVQDIEANFDYVLEMYNKNERDRRESARAASIVESNVVKSKIDRPKNVIAEKVEDRTSQKYAGDVSACLEGLSEM